MSTTIAVEATQNIADIEDYYHQLYKHQAALIGAHPAIADLQCDLMLPTRLHNWRLGGKAALIQFIITWAKQFPSGKLITHVQRENESEVQLDRLCNTAHGLIAILMAGDVVSKKGDFSIQNKALGLAEQRINAMSKSHTGTQRGSSFLILCADHTSLAYLPAVYHQMSTERKLVKGSSDFINLAISILESLRVLFSSRVVNPSIRFRTSLGRILQELFANTDEWARTDWTNKRLDKSVRGITFDTHLQHNPHTVDLQKVAVGSEALANYLNNPKLKRSTKEGSFLEVTVFDSGPGLAQRRRASEIDKDSSLEDEYQAIMECLEMHGTTSEKTQKGVGLDTVMRALNAERGFIRIRTGRLCLFRDFIADPFKENDRKPKIQSSFLNDWKTLGHKLTKLDFVEGTFVTMLIPIPFKDDSF